MSILVNVSSIQVRDDVKNPDGFNITELEVDVNFEVRPPSGRHATPLLIRKADRQFQRLWRGWIRDASEMKAQHVHRNAQGLPVPVHPDDRIGMRLDIPGSIHGPFYRMARVDRDPLGQFFDMIQRLMQSDKTLLFQSWTFLFQVFHVPRGGGGRRMYVYHDDQLPAKKSVVCIREDGTDCLWRALVVCQAYHRMTLAIQAAGCDSRAIKKARATYRRVARASSQEQTQRARAMRDVTNTSTGSFQELETLARHCRAHITVINRHVKRLVEYQTSTRQERGLEGNDEDMGDPWPTFYLLRRSIGSSHYDAINSITGFFACAYYCDRCNVRYNTRYQHQCRDLPVCPWCRGEVTDHTEPRVPPLQCRHCHRAFDDENCYTRHFAWVCGHSWYCDQCHRTYPYQRRKTEHVCHERRCRHCQVWHIPGAHRCYVQPKPSRVALRDDRVRFFDFESDIVHPTSPYHVPNFAVATTDGHTVDVYHQDGASVIDQFCRAEFCEARRGTTFVAHNAKGYDAQFIKAWCAQQRVAFDYVPNGHKIMELRLPALKIRIIDSANFVPVPLSRFPAMFGLPAMRKGVYPYEFNQQQYWTYCGPLPALAWFLPGGRRASLPYRPGEERETADAEEEKGSRVARPQDDEWQLQKQRHDIIRWYHERVRTHNVWNNRQELEAYAINDVKILALGMLEFRRHFMEATPPVSTTTMATMATGGAAADESVVPRGVDPLAYNTIASACMAAYRHAFLAPDCIAYQPTYVSLEEYEGALWYAYMEQQHGTTIVRATRDEEDLPCAAGYRVRGVARQERIVYEFLDCYTRGCPECFPSTRRHIYLVLQRKWAALRQRGYHVETMWACQWRALPYVEPEVRRFLDVDPVAAEARWHRRLDVRDAFYGGRTNASCVYYTCDDRERIDYVDFTSLYPYINKYGEYPLGHAEVIVPRTETELVDAVRAQQYFGVVKCAVVPPTRLFHPILPWRHEGKLVFALCRTCTQHRWTRCQCDDKARTIYGTWCTPELQCALAHGYRLVAVREVHHFPRHSTGLFTDYVNCFLQQKQEASGWPHQVR